MNDVDEESINEKLEFNVNVDVDVKKPRLTQREGVTLLRELVAAFNTMPVHKRRTNFVAAVESVDADGNVDASLCACAGLLLTAAAVTSVAGADGDGQDICATLVFGHFSAGDQLSACRVLVEMAGRLARRPNSGGTAVADELEMILDKQLTNQEQRHQLLILIIAHVYNVLSENVFVEKVGF
jgi:hypothetical protein